MAEHPLREHAAARVRDSIEARVFACGPVEETALQGVLPVLEGMLAGVSPDVVEELARAGFSVIVVAKGLNITDAPPYLHRRGTSIDTCKGVCSIYMQPPTIAVAEKYLTPTLVHEVAHLVMDLGLGRRDVHCCPARIEIEDAFRRAMWERMYKLQPLAYILKNGQEYFACSSEAWFNVGHQRFNSGVTTRLAIKVHDPRGAAVLARIWGDGAWRPEGSQRELGLLSELVARVALPVLERGVDAALSGIKVALCVGVTLAIAHSSSARVRRLRRKAGWEIFMMEV